MKRRWCTDRSGAKVVRRCVVARRLLACVRVSVVRLANAKDHSRTDGSELGAAETGANGAAVLNGVDAVAEPCRRVRCKFKSPGFIYLVASHETRQRAKRSEKVAICNRPVAADFAFEWTVALGVVHRLPRRQQTANVSGISGPPQQLSNAQQTCRPIREATAAVGYQQARCRSATCRTAYRRLHGKTE